MKPLANFKRLISISNLLKTKDMKTLKITYHLEYSKTVIINGVVKEENKEVTKYFVEKYIEASKFFEDLNGKEEIKLDPSTEVITVHSESPDGLTRKSVIFTPKK